VAVETDVAVSRLTPVCLEAEHHGRRGFRFSRGNTRVRNLATRLHRCRHKPDHYRSGP